MNPASSTFAKDCTRKATWFTTDPFVPPDDGASVRKIRTPGSFMTSVVPCLAGEAPSAVQNFLFASTSFT
jgi:hypothetical protein